MLAKLLAPFKNEKTKVEKKAKVPKSPKKEKKKEEVEVRYLASFSLINLITLSGRPSCRGTCQG